MKTRLKAVERKAQEQNKRNRVELPLFIRHNGETDRFIVPGVIFKAIGINPEKDPKRYPVMGEPLEGYGIKSTDPIVKHIDPATETMQLHGLPDGAELYFFYNCMENQTNEE